MYYCIIRKPYLVDYAPEKWQYPSKVELKIRSFLGMSDGMPEGGIPPPRASQRIGGSLSKEISSPSPYKREVCLAPV